VPRAAAATAATSRFLSTDASLLRTALHDEHVKLGGKMVPFAGYALPVQYKDSLINSHLHCRKSASLFDVSHMGQLRIWGDARLQFLESVVVGDLQSLESNQMKLTVMTNERGGIIDDCMVTRKDDHVYMVINAGCKEKDMAHLQAKLEEFNAKNGTDVHIENFSQKWELVALQGPKAMDALSKLVSSNVDLKKLPFLNSTNAEVAGVNCLVARCGYTGEDGFEIAIPRHETVKVFHALLEQEGVLPAGLGVRDSLRLEAGMCLYGHDLNEDITPIEAALNWLISKRRRAEGGFPGADIIQQQLKDGVKRKRVGLNILSGAPAREETPIHVPGADPKTAGDQVGAVTSGTFSPVLKRPISMGYVATEHAKIGTKLQVLVRGKVGQAEVTKMPFVPANYYKPA